MVKIMTHDNNPLALYLKDIRRHKLLTASRERALAIQARAGKRKAKHALVQGNLRFVIDVAKRYAKHTGLPMSELISEGNIGLLEAAERFDPERKTRFTTYAVFWIRQRIAEYIRRNSHAFTLSPAEVSLLHRAKHLSPELRSIDERAQEIGTTESELGKLLVAVGSVASLEEPLLGDSHLCLKDVLKDPRSAEVGQGIEDQQKRERITAALAILAKRERKVLKLRFGLKSGRPQTLENIGKSLNLSKERVRQVERDALEKLRSSGMLESLKQ